LYGFYLDASKSCNFWPPTNLQLASHEGGYGKPHDEHSALQKKTKQVPGFSNDFSGQSWDRGVENVVNGRSLSSVGVIEQT